MKTIPLTRGKFAVVDDCDFEMLAKHKWHISTRGYVCRYNPYGYPIRMHRQILGDIPDNMTIDHSDRDPLNNQRSNLRVVTHTENLRNTSRRKDNTSKFKGVYFSARDQVWKAQIAHQGRTVSVGQSRSRVAAVMLRLEAVRLHYDEFAYEKEEAEAIDALREIQRSFLNAS